MDPITLIGVAATVIGALAAVVALFRKTPATMPKKHITTKLPSEDAAETYVHPTGRFQRQPDGTWNEYPEHGDKAIYTFEELRRDKKHIYLKDGSRRKDPGRPMLLRLPVAGGIAQWSWTNPLKWEHLTVIEPKRRL
jgi:hypothetical protein